MKGSRKKGKGFSKTGIRELTDADDLFAAFSGETESSDTEEDFSELIERSLAEKGQKDLLDEKRSAPDVPQDQSPPIHEQLKTYPIPQDELDLHRYTAEEALCKTESFIQTARLQGIKTVRIIVGKGIHSRGKAVLPDIIEEKIVSLKKSGQILTFMWENRSKRSSGAMIVYLQQKNVGC